jgi:hypothetical protein
MMFLLEIFVDFHFCPLPTLYSQLEKCFVFKERIFTLLAGEEHMNQVKNIIQLRCLEMLCFFFN